MTAYRSNATASGIAERIQAARRILLTTHVKPDGDGMGAALALWRAIEARGGAGPSADIYLMGPVEPRLEVIAGGTPFRLVEAEPPGDGYDLAVVLDTGSWAQLQPLAEWLRPRQKDIVGVDHHSKGDDVAALRIVDATAASTTQLLVPILDAMGCPITGGAGSVAEALFVGLATDTGWFRFSNANAQAFRLAARLIELGVDKTHLYRTIEETFRVQRLALQACALASLEYAHDGAVAIMSLRPSDFQATGGSQEDLSELVNMPMAVRRVQVSVLLAETLSNRTKISFRSKPPAPGLDGGPALDMNVLAQHFGGGGHVHAAGAHVDTDVDRARDAVFAAIEKVGAQRKEEGSGFRVQGSGVGARRLPEPRTPNP